MKKAHIGSNFDDFLADDGLLAECEAGALKRDLKARACAAELQDHSFTANEDALIAARLAEHDLAPGTAIPLDEFTAQLRSRHGL